MPDNQDHRSDEVILPLVEEHVVVAKRASVRERVVVKTTMSQREEAASVDLIDEGVEIERVAIGREVDRAPEIRRDGDVLIVPVVKEVLVKRLILVEEVRLRQTRHARRVEEMVVLRSMDATVDREPFHEENNP